MTWSSEIKTVILHFFGFLFRSLQGAEFPTDFENIFKISIRGHLDPQMSKKQVKMTPKIPQLLHGVSTYRLASGNYLQLLIHYNSRLYKVVRFCRETPTNYISGERAWLTDHEYRKILKISEIFGGLKFPIFQYGRFFFRWSNLAIEIPGVCVKILKNGFLY